MTQPDKPVVEEGTFDPNEETADQTPGLTRDDEPEAQQTDHPAGQDQAEQNAENEPAG